jgi:hypothetical protein
LQRAHAHVEKKETQPQMPPRNGRGNRRKIQS